MGYEKHVYGEHKHIKHNGSTYSRKWRELKGEDYYLWYWELYKDKLTYTNAIQSALGGTITNETYRSTIPKFNRDDNTWHLPKQFCKFLRSERDRILRGVKN